MVQFFRKPKYLISTFIIGLIAVIIAIQLSGTSIFILNKFSRAESVLPVPTLTPTPAKDAVYKSKVHSADGTMKIVLEKKIQSKFLTNYKLTASDISGEKEVVILSTTLSENKEIQIPRNSWSPDNKYLFIKENEEGKLSFFVFRSTKELFPDGKEFIDVLPLFDNKKYELRLSDITGWDSNTLLHVFTQKLDGSKGPSFWFDVESKSFYQLGSR